MSSEKKAQIIYFSHGGGPLPILDDPSHNAMVNFMKELPSAIKKPEAVIVISAHWEERAATLLGAENPEMFYDYYGFPDEAYDINYPAPGNPLLAEKIVSLLNAAEISSEINKERGFDHGLFIPLKLMYPDADIPSIQISLLKGLDPGLHITLGRALRSLMTENILIIGSGFSFHNMRAFDWQGRNIIDSKNDDFQDWLIKVFTSENIEGSRDNLLINWEKAPNARYCHPREEHLLPLFVCAGLSDDSSQLVFNDYILGKRALAFLWK